MAEPAAARATLVALRQTIARLEGKAVEDLARAASGEDRPAATGGSRMAAPRLALGVETFDDLFQGGLPLDALTEFRSAELRDAGAATGFVLALCALLQSRCKTGQARFLWIGEPVVAMEAGLPHAAGLADLGLMPETVLYAVPRKLEEALWLAEAGLACQAFTSVILEVRGNPARFGLTESRRLSLRAKAQGRPLFLLRQAGEEEASSALYRLHVTPAPAKPRVLSDGSMLGGSIGHSVFSLTLEKSRRPVLADLCLEWNPHDRLFSLATRLPRPASHGQQPAHSGTGLSAPADRPDRAAALGHVVAFGRAS